MEAAPRGSHQIRSDSRRKTKEKEGLSRGGKTHAKRKGTRMNYYECTVCLPVCLFVWLSRPLASKQLVSTAPPAMNSIKIKKPKTSTNATAPRHDLINVMTHL